MKIVTVNAVVPSMPPYRARYETQEEEMTAGDYQGRCETTSTPRYENPMCRCATYPTNLGPCRVFDSGSNGRCVYCDHEAVCHLQLLAMTHGEPNAENMP